jgi:hypothetical protein
MRITNDLAVRCAEDYSPPCQPPHLLQDGLQLRLVTAFGIKPADHLLYPGGAGVILAPFEAGHLLFRGIAHIEADTGQGQGQNNSEAHHQAELETDE